MRTAPKRWECGSCRHVSLDDDLLSATNPFDPDDVVIGCPNCKDVIGSPFEIICDEPGCNSHAVCGWPTGIDDDIFGGYRLTCGKHMAYKTPVKK